jgi:ABC-type enterochelin transport system permease subunit
MMKGRTFWLSCALFAAVSSGSLALLYMLLLYRVALDGIFLVPVFGALLGAVTTAIAFKIKLRYRRQVNGAIVGLCVSPLVASLTLIAFLVIGFLTCSPRCP